MTASFHTIERMRNSLDNFERIHKLTTTMKDFDFVKKSIDSAEKIKKT